MWKEIYLKCMRIPLHLSKSSTGSTVDILQIDQLEAMIPLFPMWNTFFGAIVVVLFEPL